MKAAGARIKDGSSFEAMVTGACRYAAFCDAAGKTDTEFVMQAATFLGPERHYLEPWTAFSKADALYERNRRSGQEWLESQIDEESEHDGE